MIRNLFVLVALLGGVAVGLANPSLGCLADRYYLSKFSTFGIFIISGLSLALFICFLNIDIDGHLNIHAFSFIYFWVVS